MKRVTKIVLGVTTLSVLATSAFACQSKSVNGCTKQKSHKMMKKDRKSSSSIIGTIMRLDLTPKQREKIITILQESKNTMKKPTQAFSDTKFNKKQFIKLVKEQKEARIEKRAETIEKTYAILNSTQKKVLKTLLDKKAQFEGGKYCDKNCNGRR